MNRHKHQLTFQSLQSLLDLPQTETILSVQIDNHTRRIWLECTGGPPTPDGEESRILPLPDHTFPLD